MSYPVLAYHKISTQWEISFTMIYPRSFERQMRFLAKKGYVGKSLKEYMADPKDNYFVLTFDDAYESQGIVEEITNNRRPGKKT